MIKHGRKAAHWLLSFLDVYIAKNKLRLCGPLYRSPHPKLQYQIPLTKTYGTSNANVVESSHLWNLNHSTSCTIRSNKRGYTAFYEAEGAASTSSFRLSNVHPLVKLTCCYLCDHTQQPQSLFRPQEQPHYT